MYASTNFQTKRDFKQAIRAGAEVILYSPELETPAINGRETVVGPWGAALDVKARHHKGWHAHVRVKDMRVVEVH